MINYLPCVWETL